MSRYLEIIEKYPELGELQKFDLKTSGVFLFQQFLYIK